MGILMEAVDGGSYGQGREADLEGRPTGARGDGRLSLPAETERLHLRAVARPVRRPSGRASVGALQGHVAKPFLLRRSVVPARLSERAYAAEGQGSQLQGLPHLYACRLSAARERLAEVEL
jgi:hypothetical protein